MYDLLGKTVRLQTKKGQPTLGKVSHPCLLQVHSKESPPLKEV